MLKRRNVCLLFCILVIAGSVAADPPLANDLYESMARAQSDENEKVVPTAAASPAKERLVAAQPADVNAPPAPIKNTTAEPIQNRPTVPPAGAGPGRQPPTPWLSPAASHCQTCLPPQQFGRGRCVWHKYIFSSEPFGFCVNGALNAQVMNGLTAQLVFYQYDFNNTPAPGASGAIDRAGLNYCGRQQLSRVAEMLTHLPLPRVVIETSRNPQIDEARRQTVIAGLSEAMGTQVPSEWVVIDEPPSNPLSGEEAVTVHDGLLRQTEQGGLYDANGRASENGGQVINSVSPTNINH
jgi:hypothetical protein